MADQRRKTANLSMRETQEGLAPHGMRHSGEGVKGSGYFGYLPASDGYATEMSAENEGGEFPLLVPTLSKEEIEHLLAGNSATDEIFRKAVEHAERRKKEGKSPYADPTGLKHPVPKADGGSVSYELPDDVTPQNWRDQLETNVLNDARALIGVKEGGPINLDRLLEKAVRKANGGPANLDDMLKWAVAKHNHKMKKGGEVSQTFPLKKDEEEERMFSPAPLKIPAPITDALEALKRQFEKEKRSMSKPGAVQDVLMRGPVAMYAGAPADILGMGGELLDYVQKKIPGMRKPASVMDTGPEKVPPMGYAPVFPLTPNEPYGTEAAQELMKQSGLTTGTERPLFELSSGVAAPFAGMAALKTGKALAPTAAEMLEFQLAQSMKPYQMGITEGGPKLSKEEYSRMMREKYAAQNLAKQEKVTAADLKTPEAKAPADDLGFYSPAEKAAMNLKRNIGTGEAFLSDLKKAPDVGESDLVYTGLQDWLAGKKTVSKAEIEDYMRNQRLRLRNEELVQGSGDADELRFGQGEVVHDEDYIFNDAEYYKDNIDDYYPNFISEHREKYIEQALESGDDINDPAIQRWIDEKVDKALEQYTYQMASDMYYDNPYRSWTNDMGYSIFGNDDVGYSIRDPRGRNVDTGARGVYDFESAEGLVRQHAADEGFVAYGGTEYHDYQLGGPSENYREHLTTIDKSPQIRRMQQEIEDLLQKIKSADPDDPNTPKLQELANELQRKGNLYSKSFTNAHHDRDDILSHSRTQDRKDNDGKNILHVDEIQSDWHQKGAEFGYLTPEGQQKFKELVTERVRLAKEFEDAREKLMYASDKDLPSLSARSQELAAKIEDLGREASDIERSVPDAPFKKDWAEKELKKLINLAAREGKDRVTLSRWQDQVERWGTDSIAFERVGDGKWKVAATKNRSITDGDLDDTITAQEVANRVLRQYGALNIETKEGLRELIQKFLARNWSNSYINRTTNKVWDQMNNLSPGEMSSIDPRKNGFKSTYGKSYVEMMDKLARKYGAKTGKTTIYNGSDDIEVPYIEITGKMKSSALKGLPYKKGGRVTKADLEQQFRMAFGGGVFNTDPDITDSGRIIPERT